MDKPSCEGIKVNIFSFFKHLKRRLRWKRRWLLLGVMLLIAGWLWNDLQHKEADHRPVSLQMQIIEPFTENDMASILDNELVAFFGIDEGGNLSLYEGHPDENQVLRSFFQIDIEYLESSLPQETVEQLYRGIRVTDYAEYNSVLSTFSDYAVNVN